MNNLTEQELKAVFDVLNVFEPEDISHVYPEMASDEFMGDVISAWKKILKNLILEHYNETGSNLSKKIIENYEDELINFIQVCPKEMLDKLENPVSFKSIIKEVS